MPSLGAEQRQRLLDRLGDARLREIAAASLDGCANEEIAARIQCSLATVERKLKLIRSLWTGSIAGYGPPDV